METEDEEIMTVPTLWVTGKNHHDPQSPAYFTEEAPEEVQEEVPEQEERTPYDAFPGISCVQWGRRMTDLNMEDVKEDEEEGEIYEGESDMDG